MSGPRITSPINRVPSGLLGFLDIKNFGQNPTDINQVVQPHLDLHPYYSASNRRKISSASLNLIANDVALSSLIVPANKAWIIDHFAASANTLTAGQALIAQLCIFNPAPSSQSMAQGEQSMAFVAGDFCHFRFGPSQAPPYVAPAGYGFGVLVNRGLAFPIAITLSVMYTEVDL